MTVEGSPSNWFSRDPDGNGFYFDIPISSPGNLYVLGLDLYLGTSDSVISIYSMRVLPLIWKGITNDNELDFGVGTRGTTYQAPTGTSQTKISDVHTAAGRSFNAYTAYTLATNHNHIFELVTNTSLDGETPTTSGHDHDGTDSEVIGYSVMSTCLGWHRADSADDDGLTSSEGDAGRAPVALEQVSGSTDTIALTGFYVPRYAGAATRTLNWAAVFFDPDSTSMRIRAETSDAITDTPFDNVSSYADTTGAAGGWGCARGTVTANDGALNWSKFRVYHTKGGGTFKTSITGVCFWIE